MTTINQENPRPVAIRSGGRLLPLTPQFGPLHVSGPIRAKRRAKRRDATVPPRGAQTPLDDAD